MGKNWCPDRPDILEILREAEIQGFDLIPSGSNYAFVLQLDAGEAGKGLAVYKPKRGEAPLWDYPGGSLYKREAAAYVLSELLGWQLVPPTIVRDGPHGVGSAQLFIEHNPRVTFFNLRESRQFELQRMALFDVVANNGDRKGGHCLLGVDGRVWGIDHGLTFHHELKLRTVIWDYAGEPAPPALLRDLEALRALLERDHATAAQLRELLSRQELSALRQRLERLLRDRRFPESGYRRPVPWPPV
ncbi:MAG TPA: SCO1664 family protein [Dehalococcoidia bacterium]|nr:SCO1664 family protein [Dehalococcoidia bacterium]